MELGDSMPPTTGNKIIHSESNDNGIRLVTGVASNYHIVKSTTFPHHAIHKYTRTPPVGITHSHIRG